jgi:hypothetical protein
LNGRIGVEISRPLKHRKPTLIKGGEYATRVTKSGAGVDADRGKAEDRELVDLGGSRVERSC